ncbi:YceI family protein [Gallionella capsiferriformans]|uniref:YceI family protein n=1 Tax=Gallionella capsiferriformans (strain ES-2) TaxID=395494 RepID=D9SG63_GALCS|nr:YceI family protein [Gallionella capsiferriformans]ADL55510.1 YceI family protein [Gallionella capsiferriformans ES-2]
MKKIIALTLTSLLSSTAYAAPETYVIDSSHSMPRFEYSHFGYSLQLSRFDTITGKITIDRAEKSGSVDVTIDAKSVNTGSTLFNSHIQGEDFFDTAKYPAITFKSSKVKFDGDKVAAVEGDLTVKGITKPVTLTVNSFLCMPHPMVKKEACGVTATTQVKRSDFNMGKYAPYVGDEVTLTIPVESVKL